MNTVFLTFQLTLVLAFTPTGHASSSNREDLITSKALKLHRAATQAVKLETEPCRSGIQQECVQSYDKKLVGLGFDKKHVQTILQNVLETEQDKSFKRIGTWDDFFHGHFLITKIDGKEKVIAILFHTQENWKAPGVPPHDGDSVTFINKDRRNLLYWLDGKKTGLIENASLYENKKLQAAHFEKFRKVGTITDEMLDETALGYELEYLDLKAKNPYLNNQAPVGGIQFFKVNCAALNGHGLESTSMIKLVGKDNQEICLDINRTHCTSDVPLEFRQKADCPSDCLFKIEKKNFKIYGSDP